MKLLYEFLAALSPQEEDWLSLFQVMMIVISGSNSSTLNDTKHKPVSLYSRSSQFIQQLGMRSKQVFLSDQLNHRIHTSHADC